MRIYRRNLLHTTCINNDEGSADATDPTFQIAEQSGAHKRRAKIRRRTIPTSDLRAGGGGGGREGSRLLNVFKIVHIIRILHAPHGSDTSTATGNNTLARNANGTTRDDIIIISSRYCVDAIPLSLSFLPLRLVILRSRTYFFFSIYT